MEHTFGVAGTAHVDAHRGIAVSCEVRMCQGIALCRTIAAAIRQEFKNGWHRCLLRSYRTPDACRKQYTISRRDPHVIVHVHYRRQMIDNAHSGLL